MKFIRPNFRKSHFYVFIGIWLFFTLWTFWIAWNGIDVKGSERIKLILLTTGGTILGPMTGAISRDWQSCCTRVSMQLLMICFPILLMGFCAQMIKLPSKKIIAVFQMSTWIICLLIWFLSGIAALIGHALS